MFVGHHLALGLILGYLIGFIVGFVTGVLFERARARRAALVTHITFQPGAPVPKGVK